MTDTDEVNSAAIFDKKQYYDDSRILKEPNLLCLSSMNE